MHCLLQCCALLNITNSPLDMISIRRYDVKGNPYEAVQDFKACNDVVYDVHIRPRGINLIGAFIPVFGENTNACIVKVNF